MLQNFKFTPIKKTDHLREYAKRSFSAKVRLNRSNLFSSSAMSLSKMLIIYANTETDKCIIQAFFITAKFSNNR